MKIYCLFSGYSRYQGNVLPLFCEDIHDAKAYIVGNYRDNLCRYYTETDWEQSDYYFGTAEYPEEYTENSPEKPEIEE